MFYNISITSPHTHMKLSVHTHTPLYTFVAGFILASMYFVFMLLLLPAITR